MAGARLACPSDRESGPRAAAGSDARAGEQVGTGGARAGGRLPRPPETVRGAASRCASVLHTPRPRRGAGGSARVSSGRQPCRGAPTPTGLAPDVQAACLSRCAPGWRDERPRAGAGARPRRAAGRQSPPQWTVTQGQSTSSASLRSPEELSGRRSRPELLGLLLRLGKKCVTATCEVTERTPPRRASPTRAPPAGTRPRANGRRDCCRAGGVHSWRVARSPAPPGGQCGRGSGRACSPGRGRGPAVGELLWGVSLRLSYSVWCGRPDAS